MQELCDDMAPLFGKLAKKYVKQYASYGVEVEDLMQDGYLLALSFSDKLQAMPVEDRKFYMVKWFRHYLVRKYRKRQVEEVADIDEVSELLPGDDGKGLVIEVFISELKSMLSALDAKIVDELLAPTKSAIVALQEREWKTSVAVSHRHIEKSLGISRYRFNESIKNIRYTFIKEYGSGNV